MIQKFIDIPGYKEVTVDVSFAGPELYKAHEVTTLMMEQGKQFYMAGYTVVWLVDAWADEDGDWL